MIQNTRVLHGIVFKMWGAAVGCLAVPIPTELSSSPFVPAAATLGMGAGSKWAGRVDGGAGASLLGAAG